MGAAQQAPCAVECWLYKEKGLWVVVPIEELWYNNDKVVIIGILNALFLTPCGAEKDGQLYHYACASWYNNRKAVIIFKNGRGKMFALLTAPWPIIPFTRCVHGIITAKRPMLPMQAAGILQESASSLFHLFFLAEGFMDSYVWYMAYGSNLNTERFRCYFTGQPYLGLVQAEKCADQRAPRQVVPVEIPYSIYFAKHSNAWGGGVAFLDCTCRGFSYGVAYLITEEQFEHLYQQENGGRVRENSWYAKLVDLGTMDGYPIKTFTNSRRLEHNKAAKVYLDVIKAGLLEHYPHLTAEQAEAYLEK